MLPPSHIRLYVLYVLCLLTRNLEIKQVDRNHISKSSPIPEPHAGPLALSCHQNRVKYRHVEMLCMSTALHRELHILGSTSNMLQFFPRTFLCPYRLYVDKCSLPLLGRTLLGSLGVFASETAGLKDIHRESLSMIQMTSHMGSTHASLRTAVRFMLLPDSLQCDCIQI